MAGGKQVVKFLVRGQHGGFIALLCRLQKGLGHTPQRVSLHRIGSLGPGPCDELGDLAPEFEQAQLFGHADIGHDDAAPRQYRNEPFSGEPLQCLSHRRTANAEFASDDQLRQQGPGRQR